MDTPKRKGKKLKKILIPTAIILVLGIAAALLLPRWPGSKKASSKVTTYNVEAVTCGNVSQTVSGSGTLTPITRKTVVCKADGEVDSVNFTVGDEVAEDDVIAEIEDTEYTAPCDGILIELPIAEGDDVKMGDTVAMVMGKDGFTLSISVDETEISDIKMEQSVSFTIDAVSGEFTGKVTQISYNGTSSGGSVNYQITTRTDYIEGVYPGMSASAEIVIEDSGEGLLVPVDAVKTSGDDKYVYLAPSDAAEGTVYEDGELDLESLTKVTVETGMSDGSYMRITADELSEGSLIVITKVTSTATSSDSEEEGSSFGGNMPGGDFDFSNIDTSRMPQGGNMPGVSKN